MAPITEYRDARGAAAAVTYGSALTFEDLASEAAPARVRPCEETLLRIIDGIVRLSTDAGERLMGSGDEARIPAGTRHRLASAGGGRARVVMGFRAA